MTALTLADFLRARYDEDAADHYPYQPSEVGDFTTPTSGCVHCGIPANTAGDRCRVLADVEAKRRIVDLHAPFHVRTANDGLNWDYRGCGECSQPDGVADGETWWPCTTLRLLALPYASHPDYDERWRP